MQRNLLGIIASYVVMCMVCIIPNMLTANNLGYGPEKDPLPIGEEKIKASLSCPDMITIDCDFNGIYLTFDEFETAGGSLNNLEPGCVVDSFAFVQDVLVSMNGCQFVYLREYYVSESCGNSYTCNQPVFLTDDDMPVINACAPDVTITTTSNCDTTYTVPMIDATDDCSNITQTDDGPGTYTLGTTPVTITVTDDCGNEAMCTFNVTVEIAEALTVECPLTIEIEGCTASDVPPYADFAAFEVAGGSASNSCSGAGTTFTLTLDNETIGGSCPITVNRTYLVTDNDGNTGTCSQQIIISDITEPSFVAPSDITVDCINASDTTVTGGVSMVLDNCDASPLVAFVDSIAPGMCVGSDTIYRSFIVTDACMNADTQVQEIVTIDTIAPVAICRDSVVLYLDSTGSITLTRDSLDGGSIETCSDLTFTFMQDDVGCNEINTWANVLMTVTDDCGNFDTCRVRVMPLDTLPITLMAPPVDTIQCIADLPDPYPTVGELELDGGSFVNNCQSGSTLTLTEADTVGMCPQTVTRLYTYVDESGNSDTTLQEFVIIDTIAPTITSCPADILITEVDICDTLISFGMPDVDDNCSTITITNDYTNNTDTIGIFMGGTTRVTFTVSDACGNSDTCSMLITVNAPPRITFPAVGTVDCEPEAPDFTDLDAFLAAGGMINGFCAFDSTTFVYDNVYTIEDSCSALLVETVTISDTLGMVYTEMQETILLDTVPPEITGCVDDIVILDHVTCDFSMDIDTPSITDKFGVDTMYAVIGNEVNDTIPITWYAQDLCGNIDSCTLEIVVFDLTSPDILINDTTVMCSASEVDTFMTIQEFLTGPGAYVYDCELDSASFMFVGETIVGGNVVRQYSIADSTGNTNMTSQTIFVMDVTGPMFMACSSDATMDNSPGTCDAQVQISPPSWDDNCSDAVLTNDYNNTNDATDTYPVGETTVIWTLTDGAGLTDTCSFTVTVNDVEDPSISCPSDTMVVCDISNFSIPSNLTEFMMLGGDANDNCGIETFTANLGTLNGIAYTVTYNVVDSAGNNMMCSQNVEVFDTTAPVIVCPSMIMVNTPVDSCSKYINIPAPPVSDNCGVIDTIFNSLTLTDDASGEYSDTTTIFWYATDAFGNTDTCEYDIIVFDGVGPDVTDPPVFPVMCIEMTVDTFESAMDIISAGGSASDNCGIETVSLISETMIGTDTIVRVYEVVDSTGNDATVTHTIVIDDTTAPSFAAPDDVTIDCSISPDSLEITGTVDTSMIMDNCMGGFDTLTYADMTFAGMCNAIDTIKRVWELTDNNGNTSQDTQLIVTIDTIAPVFDMMPSVISDIACDDLLPAQEVLTATDACTIGIVMMDTIPYHENVCSGYDITYRWIAMDACQNMDTVTATFSVLPDTTPPILIDSNNQVVFADSMCGIAFDSVPGPIFDEDCSGINITNDFVGTRFSIDTTYVTYTATNDCGLDTSVIQEVIVVDNTPPMLMCKSASVGLTDSVQNYVPVTSFIAFADDNCGIDSMSVRRLVAACDQPNSDQFAPSIYFCCDDINTTIMVEVMVMDAAGNVNTCMAELSVDDKRNPVQVMDLPNVIISCDYPLDTTDLSVFGKFTDDPNKVDSIIVDDVYYDPSNGYVGMDGLVSDECDVTIVEDFSENFNECAQGFLTRTFTITDQDGNVTVLDQLILVQDATPFNQTGMDIEWPDVYTTMSQCGGVPDTTEAGAPTIYNNDKCALISVTYEDQVFDYPNRDCPFILRHWTVIDGCQYDDSGSTPMGIWTFTQSIHVINEVPPTITSGCDDVTICLPYDQCSGEVTLEATATDDCDATGSNVEIRYRVDIDNNGSIDFSGVSSTFTEDLDQGIHRITWIADDKCGNTSQCSSLFTVRECKAPTAVCHVGLAIGLGNDGEAELWAIDVNRNSFDNCTDVDNLLLSFSSDTNDDVLYFDCDDVADNQPVELWVTDEAGNQSFCTTFIDIQDNGGFCNGNINGDNTVLGRVVTEFDLPVPNANVNIIGAEMDGIYTTEDAGMYVFEDINLENDYMVDVERDINPLEGVNTLDLVMVQRHILEIEPLSSPYKMIAADVNNSESISVADLIVMRKLILGIIDEFPYNESWRFMSKTAPMEDMIHPWPFTEVLIFANNNMPSDNDFVGMKIGDVDNSVDELLTVKSETRSRSAAPLFINDDIFNTGEEFLVDFMLPTDMNVKGMQFTVNWNKKAMKMIDIEPIAPGFDQSNVNIANASDGYISVSWNLPEGYDAVTGSPLFQLRFEGEGSGKVSESLRITSDVTEALAFDETYELYDVELVYSNTFTSEIIVSQNRPNPFMTYTDVEFYLPEDGEVSFKIFDDNGKLIHAESSVYPAGDNEVRFGEQLSGVNGVLFLKVEAAEFVMTQRMIKIE